MKRILLVSVVLFFSSMVGVAQTCTQTLRLANETYNAGRLHELPKICEKCLDPKSDDQFSKEEKRDAYKLLTQAYIYLEEPEQADKAMLSLLKTDGFFEINDKIDPAEFIGQYKKFRTLPVISLTAKFGFTGTFVSPVTIFNTGNSVSPDGKFSPAISPYFGLGVEKMLVKNKWTLSAEIFYMTKSFAYNNARFFDFDQLSNSEGNAPVAASISSNYTHTRLDFYPMIQYSLYQKKKSAINPFVAIGPGFSYLLAAENETKTPRLEPDGNSGNTISGPTIKPTSSFNKITYSAVIMAGGKFRIGSIYVTGDIRFQYGFSNLTAEKRTNQEAVFDYGFQIPDFKTHNVMATIGVIKPIFIPKKLVK
jgi:hypothetical protein